MEYLLNNSFERSKKIDECINFLLKESVVFDGYVDFWKNWFSTMSDKELDDYYEEYVLKKNGNKAPMTSASDKLKTVYLENKINKENLPLNEEFKQKANIQINTNIPENKQMSDINSTSPSNQKTDGVQAALKLSDKFQRVDKLIARLQERGVLPSGVTHPEVKKQTLNCDLWNIDEIAQIEDYLASPLVIFSEVKKEIEKINNKYKEISENIDSKYPDLLNFSLEETKNIISEWLKKEPNLLVNQVNLGVSKLDSDGTFNINVSVQPPVPAADWLKSAPINLDSNAKQAAKLQLNTDSINAIKNQLEKSFKNIYGNNTIGYIQEQLQTPNKQNSTVNSKIQPPSTQESFDFYKQNHPELPKQFIEDEMPKRPKSINDKPKSQFSQDLSKAGYRILANQIAKTTQEMILQFIPATNLSSFKQFLASDLGKGFISMVAGMSLTYLMQDHEFSQKLAKEFRINSITTFGNSVIDSVMESVIEIIQDQLKAIPILLSMERPQEDNQISLKLDEFSSLPPQNSQTIEEQDFKDIDLIEEINELEITNTQI